MLADYGAIRMRFRSSTNAEDLDGFTGATPLALQKFEQVITPAADLLTGMTAGDLHIEGDPAALLVVEYYGDDLDDSTAINLSAALAMRGRSMASTRLKSPAAISAASALRPVGFLSSSFSTPRQTEMQAPHPVHRSIWMLRARLRTLTLKFPGDPSTFSRSA